MTRLIIVIVILALLVAAVKVFEEFTRGRKPRFEYRRKDGVMTEAKRECYHALVSEMGPDYYFFPQMHLDAIVQPTDNRTDRLYAFRHINQKSVDFVACDKKQLRPLFAIELDDKTHNQPKRVERDAEVERILRGAGIPLMRPARRRWTICVAFLPNTKSTPMTAECSTAPPLPTCLQTPSITVIFAM